MASATAFHLSSDALFRMVGIYNGSFVKYTPIRHRIAITIPRTAVPVACVSAATDMHVVAIRPPRPTSARVDQTCLYHQREQNPGVSLACQACQQHSRHLQTRLSQANRSVVQHGWLMTSIITRNGSFDDTWTQQQGSLGARTARHVSLQH